MIALKLRKRRGTNYDRNHPKSIFSTSEKCCHEQNHNRDGYGGDSQIEFDVRPDDNDYDELDGKSKKKAKVELEKGDVNLKHIISRAE